VLQPKAHQHGELVDEGRLVGQEARLARSMRFEAERPMAWPRARQDPDTGQKAAGGQDHIA
jgi:hypothetical protein